MPNTYRRPFVFDPRFEPSFQLAAHGALERKMLAMRRELGLIRLALIERKYREDQARVPAGNPQGGQWTNEGGDGRATAGIENPVTEAPVLLAEYVFGRLIAEFETGDGRRCIYRFDFGTVVTPGSDRFTCSQRVPSSAVTHGYFLNDN